MMRNLLREIKNITGNSINDTDLLRLLSKAELNFKSKMMQLFSEKQKSRIEYAWY